MKDRLSLLVTLAAGIEASNGGPVSEGYRDETEEEVAARAARLLQLLETQTADLGQYVHCVANLIAAAGAVLDRSRSDDPADHFSETFGPDFEALASALTAFEPSRRKAQP